MRAHFVRSPPYGAGGQLEQATIRQPLAQRISAACQKRPTSQCGWARRAAAQTVVAQRVPGRAGNALLRDRGNKSLHRRLSECAPPRGGHESATLLVCRRGTFSVRHEYDELSLNTTGGIYHEFEYSGPQIIMTLNTEAANYHE